MTNGSCTDFVTPCNSAVTCDKSCELTNQNIFSRHLLAGAIAGAVSRTCTAPIDRIKVFYQVSRAPLKLFTVLTNFIQEGGIRSLWRGNAINVLKTAPKASIRFAFYDQIKKIIKGDSPGELNVFERVLAGSLAGLISQTFIFPLEVLKVRMILSSTGQYNGILHAATTIYKTEGIRSFGKGYTPTLLAIVPHSGFDLAGYETLKSITKKYRNVEPNSFDLFVMSSISCMIGQFVTYPLSLVATRMQAQHFWMTEPNEKITVKSIFRGIWRTEGFRGLYRGLVPNIIKFVPVVGITFITYEAVGDILGITMTK